MKPKSDLIFLTLLALLGLHAIYRTLMVGDYLPSWNNYAALAAWSITLFLWIQGHRLRRHLVAFLLILGTINILNFGVAKIKVAVQVSEQQDASTPGLGLDPLLLLMLVSYYLINKQSVHRVLKGAFKGSDHDQQSKQRDTIDFYLQKFSSCDEEEFARLYQEFDHYPYEAKVALKQLNEQRNNTSPA